MASNDKRVRLATLFTAIGAALILASGASGYATYPKLDETASWLAQRSVEVRCLTEEETSTDVNIALFGASAYVEITPEGKPSDYTVFEHGLCEKLLALYSNTWYGTYTLKGIAWALLVITHEAMHMRGWPWWKDEARVNCWAIRHTRYTALHLGAADALSHLIVPRALWWFNHQPPEYQLPGCKVPTP